MDSVIGPIILGLIVSMIGVFNMKGNISTIHWYHRTRVTEENRLPFGRMIGLGSIAIGSSMVMFGCLAFVTEKSQNELFVTIGAVVVIVGIVIGLMLSLFAMIKYNRGVF